MKNGKYEIKFSKRASRDKQKLKEAKLEKKTKEILIEMSNNPFSNSGSFEKLRGDMKGMYSRRINRQHRIVYAVNEEEQKIKVYQMWTHYE